MSPKQIPNFHFKKIQSISVFLRNICAGYNLYEIKIYESVIDTNAEDRKLIVHKSWSVLRKAANYSPNF